MIKHVVIIGAGAGGLAAAMLLSRAGCKVTVLEKMSQIGGRSSQIELHGFRFDRGATFFLYPRILEEIFASCGLDLNRAVDLIKLNPHYRLIFENGGTLDATSDQAEMERAIAGIAPADARGFAPFMADNRRKLDRFAPVLQSPFSSPADFLRRHVARALPLLRAHRSVDGDLKRFFSDPRIRLAFSFQSKYLGMSPFRCPSLFTILAFMEYEYGVFHPRGGCGALFQAMADAASHLGAEIRLNEPVEAIEFAGRRAVGVRTAQGVIPADAVVMNADFAHSVSRLVPAHLRRRWSDSQVEAKRYSCSTYMLYLGIRGTYDHLPHHTIYLAADYERNIAEIENGPGPPSDPSFYVQNASVSDPTLAPEGHSTLYVLVPVANDGGGYDWAANDRAVRAQMIRRLERIGIEDLESRIVVEKRMTPTAWQNDLSIHRGATFNLAHSLGQMLHRRPNNRFEELDGVYLVGGGTHPGSGLPVIFESARISARLLAEDLGLPHPWSTEMTPSPLDTAAA